MIVGKRFYFIIFTLLLSFVVFSATASTNGGFKYSILDGTCSSGPNAPSGFSSSGPIRIEGDFLVGPCNGYGDSPPWGSEECCLQVCENYNTTNVSCKLKSSYLAMFEQQHGDLEKYRQERSGEIQARRVQPATIEQFFSVGFEFWLLNALLLITYIVFAWQQKRNIRKAYDKFKDFLFPSKRKVLVALAIFFILSIVSFLYIMFSSIDDIHTIYIPQIDASITGLIPGLWSLVVLLTPQALSIQMLGISAVLSLLLFSYTLSCFLTSKSKKMDVHREQ